MRESAVGQRILLACSRGATRLFRMSVGLAWIGQATKFTKPATVNVRPGDVLIRDARPFKAGVKGMPDYGGWDTYTIKPEDVGGIVAVYTVIEAKGDGGKPTPEQLNFIAQVKAAGGIAGVAYSAEEAQSIIQDYRSSGRA